MCSCNRSTLAYSSPSLQPQPDPAAPVRDTRVLNDQQQTCYELLKWIFGGGAKGKMKISILLLGVEESAVRWSQTFPDSRFWYVTGIHRAKVCLHSIGFVAGTGCTVSFICHHVHCYITSFFKKTKDLDFYYIRFYVDGKKTVCMFSIMSNLIHWKTVFVFHKLLQYSHLNFFYMCCENMLFYKTFSEVLKQNVILYEIKCW